MSDASPRTPPALLVCMIGLVMSNVVFVQLTDAAEPAWLAPLYALTLAAPLLARFKENILYRLLWNGAVVAFFGRLLQHALSADLVYVLEDGLLLAVLCQVHLLNNLRAEQRPDLLFLNSYLIAVITGYITVDLEFAGAFLVYAPFFVVGLQLRVVSRVGRALTADDTRSIALDGAKRSAVLLAMTLLAFFFVPRDFHRQALFAQYFDLSATAKSYEVDFSESLKMRERKGRAVQSQRVVLTARLESGNASGIPVLWRGATLAEHQRGGGWEVANSSGLHGTPLSDPAWLARRGGLALERERFGDAPNVRLSVTREGGATQRLFLPRDARLIDLDPIHRAGRLIASVDGTVRYSNPGELRYDVELTREDVPAIEETIDADDLRPFLALRESLHTQSAVDLARSQRRKLPDDADNAAVAATFARYLSARYTYALPGEGGGANTLHEFLGTDRGGHCEMFASALATMLRAVDVPARVVTGYRSTEWDPMSATLTVRAMHAHAWVEVFSARNGGWFEIDPTPAGDVGASQPGLWQRARSALSAGWMRLTNFDSEARVAAVAWLRTLPARTLAFARENLLGVAAIGLALALLAFAWRRRVLRRRPEVVRTLTREFERAGVALQPAETPREALRRAGGAELDSGTIADLRAAVEEHERARYAA